MEQAKLKMSQRMEPSTNSNETGSPKSEAQTKKRVPGYSPIHRFQLGIIIIVEIILESSCSVVNKSLMCFKSFTGSLFSTTQELMASRPGSSISPRADSALSLGKSGSISDTIRQRMADKIRNAKVFFIQIVGY